MANRAATAEATDLAKQPYDASDPQRVNSARKKAAREHREQLEVVGGLMDLKQGRAWLFGLMTRCHIFENCFRPGEADQTAFLLGERNVGLSVLAEIQEAAPDKYILMCEEAKERG